MKTFEERDRFIYPFNADSLVIDVGSHEGNFALQFCEKYGCTVLCFEPIPEFAKLTEKNLANYPKVLVFEMGVGGSTRDSKFAWKGSMTGIASEGLQFVRVHIRDIAEVMQEFAERFNMKAVDLIKLNVEGSEYEILERLLSLRLAKSFRNIQIQWHSVVPECRVRRAAITEKLELTHLLTWRAPAFDTGHENWTRK